MLCLSYRCNARYLQSLPEPIHFVVADLSFISLTLMIPTMKRIAAPQAQGLLLIKPQFEVGREGIRDGRVRSEELRSAQESSEELRKAQKSSEGPWRPQEGPGELRRGEETSEELRGA